MPFATAGTVLPVGSYEWKYATIGYNSDRTKRVYGSIGTDSAATTTAIGRPSRGRLASGREDAALRAQLHAQPRHAPGRPLYTSNVVNFRVSHSFSPDLYLKGFVQDNDDRRTASFNFLCWYTTSPAATSTSSTTRVGHGLAADLARGDDNEAVVARQVTIAGRQDNLLARALTDSHPEPNRI